MKKSDYDNIINALADPVTNSDGLEALVKKLEEDEASFEKLNNENIALVKKNSQLALSRVTIIPNEKTPEEIEKEKADTLNEKFDSYFNEEVL